MSGTEIVRELGKYPRKTMDGVNCSANNLLTISQLDVLAEQFYIHILHTFTTSVFLRKLISLITTFN